MKIGDLVIGDRIHSRAIVVQQKTGRPVQFELLDAAQGSILAWLVRRVGADDEDADDLATVVDERLEHEVHVALVHRAAGYMGPSVVRPQSKPPMRSAMPE